jgi:hypothetical protein
MDVLVDVCAALDVHKDQITGCAALGVVGPQTGQRGADVLDDAGGSA